MKSQDLWRFLGWNITFMLVACVAAFVEQRRLTDFDFTQALIVASLLCVLQAIREKQP